MKSLFDLTVELRGVDFSKVDKSYAIEWLKQEAKNNGLDEVETNVLINNVLGDL